MSYQPGGRWVGRMGCGLALVAALLTLASWESGDLERAQPVVLLFFLGVPVAALIAIFRLNTRD